MVDLVLSHVQAVDCVCLVLDGAVQLTGQEGPFNRALARHGRLSVVGGVGRSQKRRWSNACRG